MQRAPRPPRQQFDSNALLQKLKKPQYALPAAIVLGMIGLAFGVQPKGASGGQPEDIATTLIERPAATATAPLPTATAAAATKAATSPVASATGQAAQNPVSNQTPGNGSTSDVAGARSTPTVAATMDPALQRQPTQCGTLKESTTAVAVEQSISGVSVKATKVATYPIDYFRCILTATGGQEAYSLASSILKAEEAGSTHIVLVDLWMANASKQFGQLNVRNATLSLAGQTFVPTATLGGRSEVVVSSGQGRNLSLVVAVKNTIGETTGPMTLVVEGPLLGGNLVPGKYQLFLPTP